MAPVLSIYMTLILILLSTGWLRIASSFTYAVSATSHSYNTQRNLASTPPLSHGLVTSLTWNQDSSHGQPSMIYTPTGQIKLLNSSYTGTDHHTTLLKPSEDVFSTVVNNLNTISIKGDVASIKKSITVDNKYSTSELFVSNTPVVVHSLKQFSSQSLKHSGSIIPGQFDSLSATTNIQQVISSNIPKQTSVVITTKNPSHIIAKTLFLSTSEQQAVSTQTINNSPKVLISKGTLTDSISEVMLNLTSTAVVLNPTSIPYISHLTSTLKTFSMKVMPNLSSNPGVILSTSKSVMLNPSSLQAVVSKSSTTPAVGNPTSILTMVNSTSSPAMLQPTTTPVVLNATSALVSKLQPMTSTPVVLNATSALVSMLQPMTSTPVVLNATSTLVSKLQAMTSIPVVLNATSTLVSKLEPTTSTPVVLNATSTLVGQLQTTSQTMLNASTSTPVRQLQTTSSQVILNLSSWQAVVSNQSPTPVITNITLTPVPSPVSTSVVLSLTSVYVVKTNSAIIPHNPSTKKLVMYSSTASLQSSIYPQPSTAVHQLMSTSASTLSNKNGTILGYNNISSSIIHRNTPSDSQEKTRTPLIVGLAVGLSLVVVVVIAVIVYYRRKRSAYQYNVFYDEQNIVMHPFDYHLTK